MAPCVRRWTGLCVVLTSGVDEVVLIVSPRDGDLIAGTDEPPQGTLAGAGGRIPSRLERA